MDEEESAKLRTADWSLSDEELTARASKAKDLCISVCLCL